MIAESDILYLLYRKPRFISRKYFTLGDVVVVTGGKIRTREAFRRFCHTNLVISEGYDDLKRGHVCFRDLSVLIFPLSRDITLVRMARKTHAKQQV